MKDSITSRQVIMLMMISRLATTISVMPTVEFPPNNQDIWIIVLLSIVYTHIFMIPLLFLVKKFNRVCLIGNLKNIYGKTIGKILGLFYSLYFLIETINASTIQAELVATTILSDTSESLIIVCMILTCLYCVSRGVQSSLRAVEILTPVALFIVFFMIVMGFSNIKLNILRPVFADSTILDINLGSMQLSLLYTEIFILSMLVPYLEDKEDIQKIFTKSVIYSMLILAIVVIISQISIGVEYLKHTNFPFLHFARTIEVLELFERIDLLAIVGWLIASISRLSMYILLSVLAIKEVLDKKNIERKILIVIGIISSIITIYILGTKSVIITRNYIDMFLAILFIVFAIIIPTITCIVYFIRRDSIESKISDN